MIEIAGALLRRRDDFAASGTHPPWTGSINDDNGRKAVICVIVFPSIATIFVGLRIFVRKAQKIQLGLDDYMIALSLVN